MLSRTRGAFAVPALPGHALRSVALLAALLFAGLVPNARAQTDDCGNGFAPDGTASPCSADGNAGGDAGTSPSDPVDAPDPGSAGPDPLAPPSTVGNPVSLFSGNKRELETDFAIPGADLVFRRTYNSANEPWRAGVGQGWTHTYAVTLFATPEGGRQILQSDGRRLHFAPAGTDDTGRAIFRTASAFEGRIVVEPDGAHRWELPDGRRFGFNGGYLTRIDWPDQRRLSLYYERRRLASVTDETGRMLRFAYWPGAPGSERALEGYEAREFGPAAGQLSSLTLPDGTVIGYDYDERSNLTRARYPDGTDRQYHYEEAGYPSHLTGVTERTGVRIATWGYDAQGRAVLSEGASGVGKVTIVYPDEKEAEAGREVVTRITNSLGQQSEYRWVRPAGGANGGGRPRLLEGIGSGCSSCPPTGVRWEYDGAGRLVAAVQVGGGTAAGAPGTTMRYGHDELGRLTEIRRIDPADGEPAGTLVERREYLGRSLRPSVVATPSVAPGRERTTRIEYADHLLPSRIIERGYRPVHDDPSSDEPTGHEPIERIVALDWQDGRLVAIDGPRLDVADITRFGWDEFGRLTSVSAPGAPVLVFTRFDSTGRVVEARSGASTPLVIERDTAGRVSAVRQGELVVRYAHDAEGRPVSVTDIDERTARLAYDGSGRLVSQTDDLGRAVRFLRDAEGRIERREGLDTAGAPVLAIDYVFDALGRLTRTTESRGGPDGARSDRVTEHAFDEFVGLRTLSDPATGAVSSVLTDPDGDSVRLTAPDGATTTLGFDAAGRQTSVRDPRGNLTRRSRDDFGRVVMTDSPDTGRVMHAYDPAGNRVETREADGSVTRTEFDAADRMVSRTSRDGITTWRWDEATGRLAQATNEATTERFEHDADGRLVRHVRLLGGTAFETRYAYDGRGRLHRKRLPDGQALRYHYHEDGPDRGRLRSIVRERLLGLTGETLVAEIDLDPRDGSTSHVSADGRRTTHRFATNGEIESLEVGGVMAHGYAFNDRGRIVAIDEESGTRRFDYRGGRLSSASTPLGDLEYRYDALGNRTSLVATDADGTRTERRYAYPQAGGGNRLLSSTDPATGRSQIYRYDAAGSPVQRGELRYEYDANRRPTSVHRDGRLLARYAYNAFGERVAKTVYAADGTIEAETFFLYDGPSLSAEVGANGGVVSQYVYLESYRPVAKLEGGESYAVHGDHLGAPRLMTDADGEVVWQADYEPFGGATIRVETREMPLRLPGQYADAETGTHYNYRRDYDPDAGRYLTSDPLGLADGLNTYTYVGANPLASIDPLGLFRQTRWQVFRYSRFGMWAARLGPAVATVAVANPVGTAAVVAVVIGTGAAAWFFRDYLNGDEEAFAEEVPQKPSASDYDAMLGELEQYSDTEIDRSGYRLNDSWGNFFDLHAELLAAQRRFVAEYELLYGDDGTMCPAQPEQSLYEQAVQTLFEADAQTGAIAGTSRPDRSDYTAGYVSREGVWFPTREVYEFAKSAYDDAGGENGTGLSFRDWVADNVGQFGPSGHKATRWSEYVERGGQWTYERWSNVYDANMERASNARVIEDAHHEALGWGEREVVVSGIGPNEISRRLDIADVQAQRAVEVKSGYTSRTEEIRSEIERDAMLVRQGWDINWYFDGTPSRPLLRALEEVGITWTMRDPSLIRDR